MLKKLFLFLPFVFMLPSGAVYAQTEQAQPSAEPKKQVVQKKQPIRYIVHEKRRYVNLKDVARYYSMACGKTKTGPLMFSRKNRVEMKFKSCTGSINRTKVTFFYPPIEQKDVMYISEHDFLKILDPALRQKLPTHTLVRIMLDPGHGGTDDGAPGPVKPEKDINLAIAKKLQKELKSYGFEVLMTRTGDQTVSLEKRSEMCKKQKADLYISIHCNASTNKSVSGIETWLLAAQGGKSAKETTTKKKFDSGNKFDRYNFRLAYEIQRGMQKEFPESIDRGVKASRFAVLRNATAPAVLMEVGFLSHAKEGKSLAAEKVQNKIVDAVIEGLTNYVNTIRENK